MKRSMIFATLLLTLSSLIVYSQKDIKTMCLRSSAHAGFLRISNGDLDRISYWNEGGQWGALLLADIRFSEEESVFATIGAGTDRFYSSFNTADSATRFSQAVQIKATSLYAGVSYRQVEQRNTAGMSGTLALQAVLPYSMIASLRPDPVSGTDTQFEPADYTKFSLYLYGSFQLELYPSDVWFFTIGLTANTGLTELFSTRNDFSTTTTGTMLSAGLGICF
jgi:hypothetical protein